MKLDKRHLIASIALLVGSIIYNVWVFTRPSGSTPVTDAAPSAPLAAPAPSSGVAAGAGAVTVDPSQVQPVSDVGLDRLPAWPRDPFANLAPQPAVVETVAAAPEPEAVPEPDPVVASILYSEDRRLAMIDGRVARVGDVVNGSKIVDILPNAVVIESPLRGRRTLTMRPAVAGVTPR